MHCLVNAKCQAERTNTQGENDVTARGVTWRLGWRPAWNPAWSKSGVWALCVVWATLTAISALAPAAAEERRIALVMGNSAYKQTPLANSARDARLMAGRLRAQQFTVYDHYDSSQKDMKRAVQAFSQRIAEARGDAVVFIYYAGHGVQVKGENYLIPVDADIKAEGDIDIDSVGVSSIMTMLDSNRARLSVVVLDACRNNPFGYSRSADRGLARVDAPSGSLVAFSTSPGKAAKDGTGANSPYTTALAQALGEPGMKIEEVFKKVRIAVQAATGNEQVPWESTSLTGDFYPAGPGGGGQTATTPALASERAKLDAERFAQQQKAEELRQLEDKLRRKDQENRTAMLTPQNVPAPDSAALASIAGTWTGLYSYPGGKGQVSFTFVFESAGCLGRSDELNTFGKRDAPKLFASLTCSSNSLSPGQVVSIKKTYDGTGGVSHSVIYTGVVSADLRVISGSWKIGNQSGPFTMQR